MSKVSVSVVVNFMILKRDPGLFTEFGKRTVRNNTINSSADIKGRSAVIEIPGIVGVRVNVIGVKSHLLKIGAIKRGRSYSNLYELNLINAC